MDYIFLDEVPQVLSGTGVEASRRLIHEQDSRVVEQAAGDGQLLLHPGGVAHEQLVCSAGEAHGLQQLANSLLRLLAVQVVQAGKEQQILPRGEPPVKAPLVGGDEAQRSSHLGALVHYVVAVHIRLPGCRKDQSAEDLDQRRLSRAVGADDAENLSLLNPNADRIKRGERLALEWVQKEIRYPFLFKEFLGEILRLNGVFGYGFTSE